MQVNFKSDNTDLLHSGSNLGDIACLVLNTRHDRQLYTQLKGSHTVQLFIKQAFPMLGHAVDKYLLSDTNH